MTAHPRASEVRHAFGTLLERWEWRWFLTWTFKEPVTVPVALRAMRQHLWFMAWGATCELGWIAGIETPWGADRPHGHGLLCGGEDLLVEPFARIWVGRFGGFRFERIRDVRAVNFYCSKLATRGAEVLFSDNLARFRIP